MEVFAIFNTCLLIEDKMSGGFPAARLWSGCPGLFEKLAHALLPSFWLSPYSLALWSNSLAFIRNNYRPDLTLCIMLGFGFLFMPCSFVGTLSGAAKLANLSGNTLQLLQGLKKEKSLTLWLI